MTTRRVIPELRRDEHVLPLNLPRLEHPLHRVADRLFIAVAFRTIEVTEPHFQRGLGRLPGREWIGNQRAEPEGRDLAGSVGEGYLRIAKGVEDGHGFAPQVTGLSR
jgi:hypothetical protein